MRYIRSKPYASTFFKANGGPSTVMGAIPRYKFMYYANFVADRVPDIPGDIDLKTLGNWRTGVSFKIHGIDKPNIDLAYQELNQYNRKRYAYTKVTYHPFTIKLYDTVDNKPLELWKKYFTYYFGDSRSRTGITSSQTIYNAGVTEPTLQDLNWGFNPSNEIINFFDRVELYAIYGGYCTQINYINPKIIKIDWQQYDNADSSPAELQMTLAYEAIEYRPNSRITDNQKTQFGFDIEPALTVPGVLAPNQDLITRSASDSVYSLLYKISNNSNLTPNDLTAGITNNFTVANTTLNMFNQSIITSMSSGSPTIIGQANQPTTSTNTDITLVTNPSVPSQFLGTGYSYTQQAPGVLGQFGQFTFGA